MSDATPAELQTAIAAEFERQGWEYDLNVGRGLVARIEQTGEVDAPKLAQHLPSTFLERNGVTREVVAMAIARALGGRTPVREEASATIVIADNRYQVNLGAGARITGSNLNVGDGTQLNIHASASKADVMAAVEAILRSGLVGRFNAEAARELASVLEQRSDIGLDDIQTVTTEVIDARQPDQGRAKEFLNDVAVAGLGGAFGTGIAAAVGAALPHLPL